MNIFVGRLHGRVLYASLEQSNFSPVTTGNPRRFASGMVATFEPRGFPGLEVGATRFFHVAWPDSGLSSVYFTHLFESFLKQRVGKVFAPAAIDPNSSTDNQLASLFARWVHSRSGFELYGEYGREDHSADSRDLLVEPDHAAAYGVGARKAWRRYSSLMAVRVEVLNFQTSTLARHRSEESWYRHTFTRQGHTNRGQLLAAAVGVGSGSASTIALERFDHSGTARLVWSRFVVQDRAGSVQNTNVQHLLRVERRVRFGEAMELKTGFDGVYEFNRGANGDRMNGRFELGSVWYP